jgi:cytochrome P450
MPHPPDPVAAATHPDPYPYYADLAARGGIVRDDALAMWVAASGDDVAAVLAHDACRVRPPAEPVPTALRGTEAGEVFRRLVRMNDGPAHVALKRAVASALGPLDAGSVRTACAAQASALSAEAEEHGDGPVTGFAFRFPVRVVASLLGVPDDHLAATAAAVGELVRGMAPGADAAAIDTASDAAARLSARLAALHAAPSGARRGSLLAALTAEAARAGCDDGAAVVANAIGLMTQAHDATAGLIGNTLLALSADAALLRRVRSDPARVVDMVDDLLRRDPPVQNTRRFLCRHATVAGREMREGDAVLVLLAAATRDGGGGRPARPAADASGFAFGAGAHACPGAMLARTIAAAAVEHLLASGLDVAGLREGMTYRPSPNARIPVFARVAGTRESCG